MSGAPEMLPAELEAVLQQLRWSYYTLAGAIDCSEGTVRRMAAGSRPVPADVALWLRTLANFHAHCPPPRITLRRRL